MVEVLNFIFSSWTHFVGIIVLILSTCVGLSWIVAAAIPDLPTTINLDNEQYKEFLNKLQTK